MTQADPPTRTQRLHQIATGGLRGLGFHEYLKLSELPLPEDLNFNAASRALVLRLILQRQNFLFSAACTTIDVLNTRLANLHPDDAFMFSCEATRVYLSLRDHEAAIKYLLLAQSLHPGADPDLQDYWQVVRSIVYTHMWDDYNRLIACQQARRSPPPTHPYHQCNSPSVQRGNLVWAMSMTDQAAQALPMALEVLHDFRENQFGSGIHLQFEANFLRLQALSGQPPTQTELEHVATLIQDAGQDHLMDILHATQALSALQRQQPEAAHQAFQRAFDHLEHHQDQSRSALHTYDQALPFYRARGDLESLNRLLEARMRLMESMRVRVTSIFSHLHTQTTNLHQARHELGLSRTEMVERLSAIGERHDDHTGKHTRRVAQLVLHMARALNLPDANDMAEAARLHDLGKVNLPEHILLKPGPLTPEERQLMQTHTTIGADMLSGGQTHVLKLAQIIAQHHHEHWNGQGYPNQISGQDIPLPARLVAVADVYDALISERPYKASWTPEEARAEIRRLSGTQFDPDIVNTLERVLNEEPLQTDQANSGHRPSS